MKENTKIFSPNEFLSETLPLIEEGLSIPLKVSGSSMTPFLVHGRDIVYITKPDFPLKKGDMAFFRRDSEKIVMHRIWKIKNGNCYFCGDSQTFIEGPIEESRIFGVINKVERKGKTITKKNFTWKFFSKVWIRVTPLRPMLLKTYSILRKK